MSRDRLDIAHDAKSSCGPAPVAYPFIRYAGLDDVIAFRQQRPIRVRDFLRDVAALAAYLPARKHVLNLCTDRYRFAVGLAAALCRQQITLLPPNDTPEVLKALAADYLDVCCLTDTPHPSIACVNYPEDLGDGEEACNIPIVPAEQSAVILFTSGSTAQPKPTEKPWGVLVRSARAAGRQLGVDALRGATVIGTVPHQHSYGLESTVLLALQNGLVIDAHRPFYPGDIRASIGASPAPRILVTTPVHIRALLAEPDGMPAANLVVSATAPLSSTLAAQAEACFGAPLLEIYGCTEAGQLATRRTISGDEWRCLDGVIMSQGPQGTRVSGPSVQGTTLLHDVVEQTGPSTFLLSGRLGDFVEVAGKHTSLAYLNHQLLSVEGVRDGVFLMPEHHDDERITRPMAFVVAPGLEAETVLRALRDRIDAAFMPRPLVFVEALPRNELGKLPRDALLRLAGRSRRP